MTSASHASKPPKHPVPANSPVPPSSDQPRNSALTPLNLTRPSAYGAVPLDQHQAIALLPLSQCDNPVASTSADPPMKRIRKSPTIAASTSFFGLPQSLSTASLRSNLGLHAPPLGEIDWVSLAVVYWVTLVSEASRGLMLPSTWPYFQSLGGTKQMLGVFVASFSMGRMATTVPLGYLSDNFSTSTVLAVASLIQVIGHLFYAVSPNLTVLFASRIVVGFGSATMSVCRAHLTRAVPSSLRTHHFAYLSALQFVGFAVLPGLGGVLAMLPENKPLPFMALNGYTYPAYLLVFCNFLSVFFIYVFYFDPPRNSPRRNQQVSSDSDSEAGPDVLALVVCLLVNVVFRGVVAEFETVSTPFLMEQFGLTYGSSSYRISVIGFFGLFVYLFFKPIAKRFSDRGLVLFGLITVLTGCFPLSAAMLTKGMSLPVYVLCLGMTWSLAYPIGQTAVLALFSKVLAGLPAGGFLGIFSASGSIARVGFAMVASKMWSDFGRESVFAMILGYITLTCILVMMTYKRLVPPAESF